MTDITIPPEAVEAAARAYAVANDTPELWWRLYEEKSRAALLAGLNAWPGVRFKMNGAMRRFYILPLPQEARDE